MKAWNEMMKTWKDIIFLNCTYEKTMKHSRIFLIYIGIVSGLTPFLFAKEVPIDTTNESIYLMTKVIYGIQAFAYILIAILKKVWLRIGALVVWMFESFYANWFPVSLGGLGLHAKESIAFELLGLFIILNLWKYRKPESRVSNISEGKDSIEIS